MTDSALEIQVVRDDPWCPIIRLDGELDAATAPEVKETIATLLGEGCRDLVVDMERLYLLDSAAIGVLVNTRQRVPGALRIQNPSAPVRRILESTGVSQLLEIVDSEGNQRQLLNFGISIEETPGGIPVVHLRGELDAYSVSHFRGALISLAQEGHNFMVLHLGALEFTDSMGLGGMVSIYTRLKKAGGALYIAEPSEQMAKVLRITGLDALFPISERCEDAVAAAQAASTSAA